MRNNDATWLSPKRRLLLLACELKLKLFHTPETTESPNAQLTNLLPTSAIPCMVLRNLQCLFRAMRLAHTAAGQLPTFQRFCWRIVSFMLCFYPLQSLNSVTIENAKRWLPGPVFIAPDNKTDIQIFFQFPTIEQVRAQFWILPRSAHLWTKMESCSLHATARLDPDRCHHNGWIWTSERTSRWPSAVSPAYREFSGITSATRHQPWFCLSFCMFIFVVPFSFYFNIEK